MSAPGSAVPTVLVTGFLGSGKTTFLNQLIPRLQQQGRRVAVLVNEIGDTAIDAALVPSADSVAEVTRGSIFCACVRGELVSAMRRIVTDVRPDVLVVEATGVADPGELGGFADDPEVAPLYRLVQVVCLASAARLYKVEQTLAAVRRQLALADMVVVTGSDRATASELELSLAAVRRHAAKAAVVVAPFAQLADAEWNRIISAVATEQEVKVAHVPTEPSSPLERARTMYSTRLVAVGEIAADDPVAHLVQLLPAGTERAKGVVRVNGTVQLFQYAAGHAGLEAPPPGAAAEGWLVAVGRYPARVTFGK